MRTTAPISRTICSVCPLCARCTVRVKQKTFAAHAALSLRSRAVERLFFAVSPLKTPRRSNNGTNSCTMHIPAARALPIDVDLIRDLIKMNGASKANGSRHVGRPALVGQQCFRHARSVLAGLQPLYKSTIFLSSQDTFGLAVPSVFAWPPSFPVKRASRCLTDT